jgi:hypothetical protein
MRRHNSGLVKNSKWCILSSQCGLCFDGLLLKNKVWQEKSYSFTEKNWANAALTK